MLLGLGQLLALFFVLALVAGQVAGDFHVALQVVALEQRHFAAAIEAAAVLAHMPAFIFAAAWCARVSSSVSGTPAARSSGGKIKS